MILVVNQFYDTCRSVTVKDVLTGKTRTIYDAKEALSGMKAPIVKDPKVQFHESINNPSWKYSVVSNHVDFHKLRPFFNALIYRMR